MFFVDCTRLWIKFILSYLILSYFMMEQCAPNHLHNINGSWSSHWMDSPRGLLFSGLVHQHRCWTAWGKGCLFAFIAGFFYWFYRLSHAVLFYVLCQKWRNKDVQSFIPFRDRKTFRLIESPLLTHIICSWYQNTETFKIYTGHLLSVNIWKNTKYTFQLSALFISKLVIYSPYNLTSVLQ